jgi:PhoPQ-activated pathogenicity-related protein
MAAWIGRFSGDLCHDVGVFPTAWSDDVKSLIFLLAVSVLLEARWLGAEEKPAAAEKPVERAADKDAAGKAATDKAPGPLAAYVAKKDDSYKWVVRRQGELAGAAYAELILTSQTWRDIAWKHQLFIIKPSTVKSDAAQGLLFITGGAWKDSLEKPPGADEKLPKEAATFAALAEQLKTPVAILLQVPHQPIFGGKFEDAIIAETFEKYLRTGDPEWPLLLPMVKSAVRGMDATSQFAAKEWSLKLSAFTVTGASKRGWTTWLTGAVDPRAKAIAPMVIDMLNTDAQMKHQVATWGDYSEQIHDYTDRGLQKQLGSKASNSLNAIVDPYSYRKQLTQPKLILLGTNDRYWPLDALNLYWDGLSGDKYICYCPNNGHGLKDIARIAGGLHALHEHAANGKRLPKMSWDLKTNGDKLHLAVRSDIKPGLVRAWMAKSSTRDFRKSEWTSQLTRANGEGHEYDLAIPEKGYAAMFGEAMFDADATPYFLSTNIKIVTANEPAAGSGK